MVSRLGFQRGAILRASTVATTASLAISQSQAMNRRRHLIEEAKSTMRVGIFLGMDCQRKDEEIVSKIVELEKHDLSRLQVMSGQPEPNWLSTEAHYVLLLYSFKEQLQQHVRVHAVEVVMACWEIEQSQQSLTDLTRTNSKMVSKSFIGIAQSVQTMIISRLLASIGIGIPSAILPLYISEISPTEIRGTLGSANQLFICIRILTALVAGLSLAGNPLCITRGERLCFLLLLFLNKSLALQSMGATSNKDHVYIEFGFDCFAFMHACSFS
ncbi:Plastidic glucose transporter 4 [Camellia lanceoleosa]|uniref:Plastidic glucose transporter 4 n=1 Tax=Camellia lanceoleosa TaxID=1840588 RepID=A0ACC0H5D1_9ERIC|nr:Plastidic glucose transporter 4 [Camellia lanceoleosa]